MPKGSLSQVTEARLAAGSSHLTDLCIDLMTCDCDRCRLPVEVLASYGGTWNGNAKRFDGDAASSRRFKLQPAQLDVGRWFVAWHAARLEGRYVLGPDGTPCFTVVLIGGRRSGKSDFGLKAAVIFATATAGAIVWIVIEDFEDDEELIRELEADLHASWYHRVDRTWTLINASVIIIRSSYDPDDMKQGRCDLAIVNEGQKQDAKVYTHLSAAVVDRGGLVMVLANPPDTARGQWVADLVDRSRAGKTDEITFDIDGRKNPHVDHQARAAMIKRMDERTYRREMGGEIMARTDIVFHAFSGSTLHGNVRETGRGDRGEILRDVSREFLARRLGGSIDERRAHGLDFQRTPHMAGVTARFFEDPLDPSGDPLLWFVAAVVVEAGSEDELADGLEAVPGNASSQPLIIDASGEWQDADRTKGRTSADAFRRRGWKKIFLPDERTRRNPPVSERLAATNSLWRAADRRRRAFIDPAVVELIKACREWETRLGQPNKRSPFAHLGDAASYLVYRLYPRRFDEPRQGLVTLVKRRERGGYENL